MSLLQIYIDPLSIALNSKNLRNILRSGYIKRIYIPVMTNGYTVFSKEIPPFSQIENQKSITDILSELISECSRNKIETVAQLDLLKASGHIEKKKILKDFVHLLEMTSSMDYGDVSSGQYLNFMNDEAKKVILQILETTIQEYSFDYYCLRFELNSNRFFGFSELSREKAIQSIQIDLADTPYVAASDIPLFTQKISNWRLDEAGKFMQSLCTFICQKKSNAKILLFADSNIYAMPLKVRGRSLNDWLSWSGFPGVCGILFNTAEKLDKKYLDTLTKDLKLSEKSNFLTKFDKTSALSVLKRKEDHTVVLLQSEVELSTFLPLLKKENFSDSV